MQSAAPRVSVTRTVRLRGDVTLSKRLRKSPCGGGVRRNRYMDRYTRCENVLQARSGASTSRPPKSAHAGARAIVARGGETQAAAGAAAPCTHNAGSAEQPPGYISSWSRLSEGPRRWSAAGPPESDCF